MTQLCALFTHCKKVLEELKSRSHVCPPLEGAEHLCLQTPRGLSPLVAMATVMGESGCCFFSFVSSSWHDGCQTEGLRCGWGEGDCILTVVADGDDGDDEGGGGSHSDCAVLLAGVQTISDKVLGEEVETALITAQRWINYSHTSTLPPQHPRDVTEQTGNVYFNPVAETKTAADVLRSGNAAVAVRLHPFTTLPPAHTPPGSPSLRRWFTATVM